MSAAVFAIGDSVMQGAGPDLYATLPARLPGIEVDAVPYRQLKQAPPIVEARLGAGRRPDAVVVHLGTNGIFTDSRIDELMSAAGEVPAVFFVTVKAPRDWEAPVNELLTRGVERHERASLVDWWAVASDHPEYLRPDGFHLTPTGAQGYAEVIAAAVAHGA